MNSILEPTEGRKRYIVSYKQKTKRANKDLDKTALLQQNVGPHLDFVDVLQMQASFAPPADPEGLIALDINDFMLPTVFASLTEKEVESLSKDPNVDKVEPDGMVYATGSNANPAIPLGIGMLDTSSPMLKDSSDPSMQAYIPWGISTIGATSCWEATQAKGIWVAVIDTGIWSHKDLAGNFMGGVSFVPGETYLDGNGHGTHVAGTIAARMNGGIVGVAPSAYVYGIKVLRNNGAGAWSWLMSALYWMRKNYGCLFDVANMSMGGTGAPSALEAYINYAAQTTLLVAAAGNNGGAVIQPARYTSCLAVSAIDSANTIASFSSRGPQIELCAPGVNILSTLPGNRYGYLSGTSMAAPHVSGAAALCRGTHRGNSMQKIRKILLSTATDLGSGGRDNLYGYGRVNCPGAVFHKTCS